MPSSVVHFEHDFLVLLSESPVVLRNTNNPTKATRLRRGSGQNRGEQVNEWAVLSGLTKHLDRLSELQKSRF